MKLRLAVWLKQVITEYEKASHRVTENKWANLLENHP